MKHSPRAHALSCRPHNLDRQGPNEAIQIPATRRPERDELSADEICPFARVRLMPNCGGNAVSPRNTAYRTLRKRIGPVIDNLERDGAHPRYTSRFVDLIDPTFDLHVGNRYPGATTYSQLCGPAGVMRLENSYRDLPGSRRCRQ